eukprot:TRINITY_DN6066_c0_g1_i1.p1 TRINITY_DN6066_c0_g1~~TRINITY_DN6066_c0_g1_i1.p1  ORF type:complete len:151 (+),score=27.54 TRINITY_DN6066_c0_g1_i1:63-515(+)
MAFPTMAKKILGCGNLKGSATTPVSTVSPVEDDESPASSPVLAPLPHVDSLQLTRKRLGWKPSGKSLVASAIGVIFERFPSLSTTCSSNSLDSVEQMATSSTSLNTDYEPEEPLAENETCAVVVANSASIDTAAVQTTERTQNIQHKMSL